jgi:hypothetical protein
MVYTQRKCKILTNSDANKKVLLDVFKAVRFMMANNAIANDLAPHNWGMLDGHAGIIDYHGLKNYEVNSEGIIKSTYWWHRIVRNLVRYMSAVYCPDKRKKLSNLIEDYSKDSINKISDKSYKFPSSFIKLIEYMHTNKDSASLEKLIKLLDDCIAIIEKL